MTRLDVLAVGESLGLFVPDRVGRLAHVRDMRLGFGGAESNVAIGVARLGGAAGWIGRVGDDGIGELIVRELRAEGVDTHAAVDAVAATAVMLKERVAHGSTRVTYYRSGLAGSRLSAEDLPPGLVEGARVLHVSGISAGLGTPLIDTVHTAVARARAAGVTVSFDVNHRRSLWADEDAAAAAYRALAAEADIVFAGDDEARLLTGEGTLDGQLTALRALGPGCVVVKRGARGAVAQDANERQARPADVVTVVDTVGAGDAFVAGWLTETVRGAPLATRLATATACGAFACTVDGDWEAAPSPRDLARLHAPAREPVER